MKEYETKSFEELRANQPFKMEWKNDEKNEKIKQLEKELTDANELIDTLKKQGLKKNEEAVQRFFEQEVQLGEELLGQGDIENGVEHLSLAVAVCGQPQSLLGVLQQTLPPQIFSLLLKKVDLAQKKIRSHVTASILENRYLIFIFFPVRVPWGCNQFEFSIAFLSVFESNFF